MARRQSVFREVGLGESEENTLSPNAARRERPQTVRFRSRDEIHVVERFEEAAVNEQAEQAQLHKSNINIQPTGQSASPLPQGGGSLMYRFAAVLLVLFGLVPFLQTSGLFRHNTALPIPGVSGGVIPEEARSDVVLERRQDSTGHWCFKWAQQSALVNGTLYLYGGQEATQAGQTENTWNNDFLTLDLTKTWQIGTPTINGLPQPSGPPAVALGYLWNSMDSLYLYGGEFSWKPVTSPVAFSTWEYDIASSSWIEHSDPMTSSGDSAPDGNVPVQRAAEGAGVNIPSLGRGFYFGGHLDGYTTEGWSQSIPRVYLQSLLEYTFPGQSNPQVQSLQNGATAGIDGVYRNITQGGLQADAGFTQRADGLLIYVPGFGDEGILLALAGGTNQTFTQMNQINVYDIATSSWYTQATAGSYPKTRVNPCAVMAAAADGSSYNLYMFGGQNLIPAGSQTQYSDMWILSLPSFTWIEVDQSKQSVPYGRSGATCNVWDAQMVMVGGYVGSQLTCEYPGIYVLNLSTVTWEQQFTALGDNADGLGPTNALSQQPNQIGKGAEHGGLEGSYGYEVPDVVISVIGGNKYGGATITKPVATATAGPLATGSPVTYTVTKPNGQVVTATSLPGSNSAGSGSGNGGPNIAAIVVGVVCGVLFLVILYLLFCLFLYRKQLQLYKRHVEMSQQHARGEKGPEIPGLWNTTSNSNGTGSNRIGEGNQLLAAGDSGSQAESNQISNATSGITPSPLANSNGTSARRSSTGSSTEDLLAGHEPTFVGVMLNPRRSLKVINRD